MKIKILIVILFLIIGNSLYSQWKRSENIPSGYDDNYWLDIYFLESNPDFGWVCGYHGLILWTTNGGNDWHGSQVRVSRIDTLIKNKKIVYDTTFGDYTSQLESIHFASEKVGYTSGGDKVFKSTDGGITWNNVAGKDKRIWGVYFVTEDLGMAVGGGCSAEVQYFQRTTNGGKTWTTFNSGIYDSGLSDAMLYSTDGLGYASGSGYIWITNDGGLSWDTLSKTGDNDWQEEITNKTNSFLVPYSDGCSGNMGDGGLRMSVDYGKSWLDFRTNAAMFGTFLLDTLRGWGCGGNAEVYYTSDGGNTWELRNCGINRDSSLDDIWFINDTLGWVVGSGIYKSMRIDTINAKIISNRPLRICEGDSLNLSSDKNYLNYQWSTGAKTKSILVNKSGLYVLNVFNNLCDLTYSDSIFIDIIPKTEVKILTDKPPEICEGDSVSIWILNKDVSIEWSTGASSNSITAKKSGSYYVTITDSNACEYSQAIDLIVHPMPPAKIRKIGDPQFCDGDSVILATTEDYFSYSWFEAKKPDSSISADNKITVYSKGSYYSVVKNDFGCIDTTDIVDVNVWFIPVRFKISSVDNSDSLDFDTLDVAGVRCLELRIENTSGSPITITNLFVMKNIEFSVPQSQIPLVIDADSYKDISVCFRPLKPILSRDTILLVDTCFTYSLPLLGVGNENYYSTETDCNVKLEFRTKSINEDQYFEFDTPFPNPSIGLFKINMDIGNNKKIPQLKYQFYNSFGEELKLLDPLITGIHEIVQKSNKSGEIVSNRNIIEINFNSGQIPNGVYFLNIIHGDRTKGFKVMIYN